MADTTSTRPPFNPTWLSVVLSLVVAVLGVGATWKTVTSLEDRVKMLESWKSSQDVAFTLLQSDVGYIKDAVKDIRSSLSAPAPQVVYPQYPPAYPMPAQPQQNRRQQVAPRGEPRRALPSRRRWHRAA